MKLVVNGAEAFVATGGWKFDPALPTIVFLHGAGLDHSVWALLARSFSYRGFGVLAPDLPGHGRSAGTPLSSIVDMADWTAALMMAAGVQAARMVGHSMGSLVALEFSARHPERTTGLALIATAAPMRVSDDLLNAAKANDHAAVDMIAIWGNGYRATLGGSLAPGLWMLGGAERLLERARPGVLFADLTACDNYGSALVAAGKVTVPTIVILGGRDVMTPAKSGKALAAAIPTSRVTVLEGAGHLLLSERPEEVFAALRGQAPVHCRAADDIGPNHQPSDCQRRRV